VGVVNRPAWFRVGCVVAARVGSGWVGAGVHADLYDLVDHGHLASFGLPCGKGRTSSSARRNREVRHCLSGVWSGPWWFQRLTAGLGCEGLVITSLSGASSPAMVGRCSPQSTSFVLAVLRALQVDCCCAPA
jgi:hypothetical protein